MLGSAEIAESGVKVSSRILRRYVLRGEQVEIATRQHWAKLAEPVFTVIISFFVVFYVSVGLERAFGEFGLYLWWVWFGVIGRLLWRILEWRNEWFVATDKRVLLTYGLFTHKVAMMPMIKVTDLNYGRSIMGRMLGYGDFTFESAGQDQALRKINWLPSPDQTYRRMGDILFGTERFDSEDGPRQRRPPAEEESELTDFEQQAPAHPEESQHQYPSSKIAAEADGGSADELDADEDDEYDESEGMDDEPPEEGDEGEPASDRHADGDEAAPGSDDDEDPWRVDGSDDDEDPWRVDGSDDDEDPWRVDGSDEGEPGAGVDSDPHRSTDHAAERAPDGEDDIDAETREDNDDDDTWVVDEKVSDWGPRPEESDNSWQSSREGSPAYQRVQPRKPEDPDDEDITGPIPSV